MRVLMVSASYYPYIGSIEYIVKSIAEKPAKMGHEITVLARGQTQRNVLKKR